MESRRSQVARLRRVAIAAVAEFGLPEGTLVFVSHGENTTFRHDSAAGCHLVRVHRPMRHGADADTGLAIRSEVDWLRAIRAQTDLEVPVALETPAGEVAPLVTAGGPVRHVSILRWMDGSIREASARPIHLRRLGEAMAALHEQADGWTPPPGFTRIRWDHEAFFGDAMVYGGVPAADCWRLLPASLRGRFEAVADRARGYLDDDTDRGLIHADLHLGNALFAGDRVKLIDFDDCGTGPRLYDLAVAVWELRDGPDYTAYRDALLAGYVSRRAIDATRLDDYIAVRQISFDLWYTGTAQVDPHFAARLDRVHRWSASMLDLVDPAGSDAPE